MLNNPIVSEDEAESMVFKDANGNAFQVTHFDQLRKVVDNLTNGIDDRGEIVTFIIPEKQR